LVVKEAAMIALKVRLADAERRRLECEPAASGYVDTMLERMTEVAEER
jgi:hypothetical protein